MDNESIEKYEDRGREIAGADKLEWTRILENPELIKAIHLVQAQYGLPIETKEWTEWWGLREPIDVDDEGLQFGPKGQRRENLRTEIENIEEQFEIPPKFHQALFQRITFGQAWWGGSWGFPRWKAKKDGDKIRHELIITPETDIGNPLVIEFIKIWQRQNRSTPPSPVSSYDNPRKLDWRPVYEWHMRHPDVSLKKIAEYLDYSYARVRLKLSELDKEFPEQEDLQ